MASDDNTRAHRHRDERHSRQDDTRLSTRRHRGRRSQSPSSSSHARRRSGSPHRRQHATAAELPFSARQLSKADLAVFRPLFGYYLSVQKQIELEDMDEREVKGRWKSFIGKWNRGELAEGWYDPDMFARISAESRQAQRDDEARGASRIPPNQEIPRPAREMEAEGDSEDDYGPVLPSAERLGPGVPSLQDLEHRDELLEEDRADSRSALHVARKADRALQKERLDDLAPRADAGTRERRLENRAALNAKMQQFRDRSPGAMEESNEREVMGDDGVDGYKRMKKEQERKKSEREIRREEMHRAKMEEMEEKRRKWREREEGTVNMLKQLAKERFG